MDQTTPYISQFAERTPSLPGGDPAWLAALRADGIERFAASGFPTIRSEAWKYTDLRRMLRTSFTASPDAGSPAPEAASRWRLDGAAHRLVFVDGRLAPSLSDASNLPEGARLAGLHEAPELLQGALRSENTGLEALNTAFMAAGAVLQVDDGVVLDAPVHLVFLATEGSAETVSHPRILVALGEASEAELVETYAGPDGAAYWTNAVSGIKMAPGARLRHVKLQHEGGAAYHTALTRITLARDAAYDGLVVSIGGAISRNEILVRMDGAGAECRIDGATLLRGRQHADNTTEIVHAATDGASRQVFKGVLDGASRSVFQGRVRVEPGAQRTNAHQLNRNLLLSPGAEADSKPELVIHADDVKCSHGATTGDLDREALFYLRARGIGEDRARALLIEAFIGELIEDAPVPAAQSLVAGCVEAWLEGVAS